MHTSLTVSRRLNGNFTICAYHSRKRADHRQRAGGKHTAGAVAQGCWTPVAMVGVANGWGGNALPDGISINFQGDCQGLLQWSLLGEHNLMNGLAALAAARHSGVPINIGIEALRQFKNVKRRMEVRGVWNGITLYDDFAHHPTAIRTTLDGLRSKVKGARIIAVLEPRSNTMKMGVWKRKPRR